MENGSGNDYYNRWRENQKEKVVSEQRPEQNPQQANSRPLSKLSNTDKEGAGTEHYKIEDVTDDPRVCFENIYIINHLLLNMTYYYYLLCCVYCKYANCSIPSIVQRC